MPSPLASIYSAADSFKRGLLDAVQNPVDKMRQVIGNANDRAGVLNALTGQAADQTMASIKSGGSFMPDTPESRQLTQMVTDAYNPMGLTVFHGSPYKFNAFKSSQIGSGEGAQAYGYGHYLAESPNVAKFYQPRDLGYEDQLMTMYKQAEKNQDWGSLTVLEDALTHSTPSELLATHGEKFKPLIDRIKSIDQTSGLYKVDLPDDQIARMLNWDLEINKQTPEIQALAKQYNLAQGDLGGDLVAAMNAKLPEGAKKMSEAGIPGIRYFDAQKRGGNNADTSNFVVFPQNEGLLRILERNDIPIE